MSEEQSWESVSLRYGEGMGVEVKTRDGKVSLEFCGLSPDEERRVSDILRDSIHGPGPKCMVLNLKCVNSELRIEFDKR